MDRDYRLNHSEEAAKTKFTETLGRLRFGHAVRFSELLAQDLITFVPGEEVRDLGMRQGIAFIVSFSPQDNSATAIIGIDADDFNSRGPKSVEGAVIRMLEKFGACERVVVEKGIIWRHLQDSEIETFIQEALSGEGDGYSSLRI